MISLRVAQCYHTLFLTKVICQVAKRLGSIWIYTPSGRGPFFKPRERLTPGYVCHLVAILYPWLQLRRYLPRSGEVKKLTILKHIHARKVGESFTNLRWELKEVGFYSAFSIACNA